MSTKITALQTFHEERNALKMSVIPQVYKQCVLMRNCECKYNLICWQSPLHVFKPLNVFVVMVLFFCVCIPMVDSREKWLNVGWRKLIFLKPLPRWKKKRFVFWILPLCDCQRRNMDQACKSYPQESGNPKSKLCIICIKMEENTIFIDNSWDKIERVKILWEQTNKQTRKTGCIKHRMPVKIRHWQWLCSL